MDKVKLDPEKERERKELIRLDEKLTDKQNALDADQERYLRRAGWKYTCNTPGSLWLWERTYKGNTLLVPTSTALYMQRAINSGVYPQDG